MKIKAERNELMARSYILGATIRELAHDFGINPRTVRDVLVRWENKTGVKIMRPPGKPRQQSNVYVNRQAYFKRYWDQNKQFITTARKLNVPIAEARRLFK